MIFTYNFFIGPISDAQHGPDEARVPQSPPLSFPISKALKCWTSGPTGGFLGHMKNCFNFKSIQAILHYMNSQLF